MRSLIASIALFIYAAGGWAPVLAMANDSGQGADLVILLDRSGSMRKNDPRGLSKALALYLIDQFELADEKNRVAVVLFATRVTPLAPALSKDFVTLQRQIDKIPDPDGLTDLEMGLKTAYRLLSPLDDGRRKQVVILSDGMPYPDPADRDRFPDIARQFLKRVKNVDRHSQKYTDTLIAYSKRAIPRSMENIDKVVLPSFEGKIEIYPIGLRSTGTDREFLKQMALRTTRMEEAFTLVEDTSELVLAAERIANKGDQSLLLLRDRVKNARTKYQKEFLVDPHLIKARVVLHYLEEGVSADDFDIVLMGPDGEQITRETGRYLGARDHSGKGSLVFERFFLDNVTKGTWRVELKSRRKTKVLPPFELLVEGRTRLKLVIEANPPEVQVPGNVELRAMLNDPEGRPAPIARAKGEIRDHEGNMIPVNFTVDAGGVAVGRVELPDRPLGDYLVTVQAFLQANTPQGVRGRTSFLAKPAEPIELSVVIPYGADPTVMAEGGKSLNREKIVFPPVGDHELTATIKGIKVENISTRPAAVSISVGPLSHQEGELLDGTRWLQIRPRRGNASQQRPFQFDLTVKVPSRIPATAENGLYEGVIKISSPGSSLPLEVPVEFTLNIPKLQLAGTDANHGLSFSLWWMRPGQQQEKFRVRTNSASQQKVTVRISPYLTNKDGETMDFRMLSLSGVEGFDPDLVIEPGKTVAVPLLAKAGVPDIRPGIYHGEVLLDGERARDIVVPVSVEVPTWMGILIARWAVLGTALLGLVGVIVVALRMRAHWAFFRSRYWRLQTRRDFVGDAYTFAPWFSITFDPATESYRISDLGGGTQVINVDEPLPLPAELEEGHEIQAGRYQFRITRLSPLLFQARTLASPYSWSRHMLALSIFGFTALISIFFFIRWTTLLGA